MTQPTGLMLDVDHLVPNKLTEYELAKIRVEYDIPASVTMHVLPLHAEQS